jgi:hypothetical protein
MDSDSDVPIPNLHEHQKLKRLTSKRKFDRKRAILLRSAGDVSRKRHLVEDVSSSASSKSHSRSSSPASSAPHSDATEPVTIAREFSTSDEEQSVSSTDSYDCIRLRSKRGWSCRDA